MSLFVPTTQSCPNCGTSNTFDAFFSVNADRRPDLRLEILAEEFMAVTCSECGTAFRLEPDLNYLDLGCGIWILARPISGLAEWGAEEAAAQEMFAEAFGERAHGPAREIGKTLAPRLTVGWAAFREKLVAQEAGLDDVVLEEVKLFVLRQRASNPVTPGVDLRLLDSTGDDLRFGWVEGAGGAPVDVFDVSLDLYETVAGDPQWQDLGAQISAGLFVDAQRLFVEPAEPAAAAEPA